METEKLMELRKWRGQNIAKTSHIVKMAKNEWAVPSQSKTGAYTVKFLFDKKTCICLNVLGDFLLCSLLYEVYRITYFSVRTIMKASYKSSIPIYTAPKLIQKLLKINLISADLRKF